jgi:predicted nucleic acid-binding Zn ribbon protein
MKRTCLVCGSVFNITEDTDDWFCQTCNQIMNTKREDTE